MDRKAVWLAREQAGKKPLALDQRLAPQIRPSRYKRSKANRSALRAAPAASACCRAPKSAMPTRVSTMASPSM